MKKPLFVIEYNKNEGWEFTLYIEDGMDLLTSFDYYPTHDECLADINLIRIRNQQMKEAQWYEGWTETGEEFLFCYGIKKELLPIATTLHMWHNSQDTQDNVASLLVYKIGYAEIHYEDPDTKPASINDRFKEEDDIIDWELFIEEINASGPVRKSDSDELTETIFSVMMSNPDSSIYYNSVTNEVVLGYYSRLLSEDQLKGIEIQVNKRLVNVRQDKIIPGIHFLVPRLKVKSYFNMLLEISEVFEWFGDFNDEFMTVLGESYNDLDTVYFNEQLTNRFFKQVQEWQMDTGSDPQKLTKLLDITTKKVVTQFLDSIR